MCNNQPTATHWVNYWNQVGQDQLYERLLNSIDQAVIVTDLEGVVRCWNRAAEKLYGWAQDDVLGRPVLEISPVAEIWQQSTEITTKRQGDSWSGEYQVCDRQGRDLSVRVNNAPIQDAAGDRIGIMSISADVSAFRATEAQLAHRTHQAQALARVIDAIHQSLDLDTIFSVSAAHIADLLQTQVAIVEYLPESQCWVHRIVFNTHRGSVVKPHSVISDIDNPFSAQLKRLEVVQINDTRTIEDPINKKLTETDPGAWLLTPISIGEQIWGSLSLGRLHQYTQWKTEDIELAQHVAAQLAIAIDQAQIYRQLQQELVQRRASEDRLRQYEHIVSATFDGVALLDRQYTYRMVNQIYLDWNQKTREEIVGRSVADLLGMDVFESLTKPRLDRCLQGEVIRFSDWFSYSDGNQRYVVVTYSPYDDSDGCVSGVVVNSRDITDLKLAQDALLRQAEQERAINDVTRLMHRSLDLDTMVPLAVEAVSALLEADHGAVSKFIVDSRSWQCIAEYRKNLGSPSCLELQLLNSNNHSENLVVNSLLQGKVICVDECAVSDDPTHRQLAQIFSGAWLIVPLKINQRTWGLILRKRQPQWMDGAVNLAIRIADQLAIGISQAELYQTAQAELKKRQKTERALKDQESFFQSLYEQATLGIAFCRSDGQIVQVNAQYCVITGYSERELKSMTLDHLTHPDDRGLNQEIFWQATQTKESALSVDRRYLQQDGTVVWVHLTTSVIRDEQGAFKVMAVIIQDISDRKRLETERQQAEAQLRHNAMHDALTQLSNRNLLMAQLQRSLDHMRRPPHQQFAVMFLDLDRFKLVNDSLGHLAGDQLLIIIANLLSQLVRPGDLVARLGGDEFVILLDNISDISEVLTVADRILNALRQPLQIEEREVFATASIGVVIGSLAYQNATELLRDADIAMYRAKANGKNNYALFDPTLHDQVMYRLQLEHDLHRAIGKHQLELYYQPIVNLKDGSIFCLEALMRWRHPEQGLISPDEFIPIAEETGLVVALDQWALQTACWQLKQWQSRFSQAQHLKVSVNLSAQDLQVSGLVDNISSVLAESHLDGQYLVLEMTESLLISDMPQVVQLIAQLQALSVKLAVDDFGTGYSSLSYLHRFPLSALKIDQSFTLNMREGLVNQDIIETIVALSDRLGMVAIAEGSENIEQVQHLRHIGCEYSQGYYFCKPLPAVELTALFQMAYPFAHKLPTGG
ncbi:MAG: EAL domain-containing protein [Phormidesmis sp.]